MHHCIFTYCTPTVSQNFDEDSQTATRTGSADQERTWILLKFSFQEHMVTVNLALF